MRLSAPTKTQHPGAVPSDLTGSIWTWPDQPASDGEGHPHSPIAHCRHMSLCSHGRGIALGLARPRTPHSTKSTAQPCNYLFRPEGGHGAPSTTATVPSLFSPPPGPGSSLTTRTTGSPATHSLACTTASPTLHLDTTCSSSGTARGHLPGPSLPGGSQLLPTASQARNSAPCFAFPSLQPRGRTEGLTPTNV